MSECNSMDSNSKQDPTVLEVHCLDCDNVYKEEDPIVEKCPTCGNTNRMRTVYLQIDYESGLKKENNNEHSHYEE